MGFIIQFLKLILILFSPLIAFFVAILVKIVYEIIIQRIKEKKRFKKRVSTYVERSFFKKILVDFPRQFVADLYERDPEDFPLTGITLYCGHQGSGKTLSVVYDLMRYKSMFPNLKIRTNMEYKFQDGEITCGDDLISNNNGKFGQVEVIDEIQTWYSSLQSKNFPPELINEVSQQRKQTKLIIGTAQVFSRIAKPLREQCTRVVIPKTYLGCITVCRVTSPQFWDDNKQVFTRFSHSYFFIHNDEIRSAYDTYKKIEKMKEAGFRDFNPLDHREVDLNLDIRFKK